MKSSIKLILIFFAINVILFSEIFSAKNHKSKKSSSKKNKKQVHIVHDQNGFQSHLDHVVRRDPSVTVVTKMGAERLEAPSNIIYSSNSNTSNGPNVGFLGRTAELVGNYSFQYFFSCFHFFFNKFS